MSKSVKRPCKEHTFLTHIDDVRNMEENLLQILDDFNNEKNSIFDNDDHFDKLDQIREHQEQLMKLHFSLDHNVDEVNTPSVTESTVKSENVHNTIPDENKVISRDYMNTILNKVLFL